METRQDKLEALFDGLGLDYIAQEIDNLSVEQFKAFGETINKIIENSCLKKQQKKD